MGKGTQVKPSTTKLLLQALKKSEKDLQKISSEPMSQRMGRLGDLPFEKIVEIAIEKKPDLLAKTLKAAVKTILGSARSLGITVDGKDPKRVTREVEEGLYDAVLAKYEKKWEEAED